MFNYAISGYQHHASRACQLVLKCPADLLQPLPLAIIIVPTIRPSRPPPTSISSHYYLPAHPPPPLPLALEDRALLNK
eukprot:1988817-Pyramimonas_sp.AAC.2